MMLAHVKTCAIQGVDAVPVDVEVIVREGKRDFVIIGLGDSAVRESRDRVTSAIRHSGFEMPEQVLINLAPAEMKKEGSSFDLPMALGILAASGQMNSSKLRGASFHGELSLDGKVKPVRGALAFAIESLKAGHTEVIVPDGNSGETALIGCAAVRSVSTLAEAVRYLNGEKDLPRRGSVSEVKHFAPRRRISEVWGQEAAKRALIIAAAGSHNVLLIGPPGCGKSMLAERFSSLLPPLLKDEMLEVVRIHSIAGNGVEPILSGSRPFRSPHHVVSDAGLVGGGSIPKPGEISLAHRGVLFLDEFPEFKRSALEALRAPLESGHVQITRARQSVKFPAAFQLIAAMNPCPCGRLGIQPQKNQKPCLCSRPAIDGYLRKLSQPILDRIDLHVELDPVPLAAIVGRQPQNAVEQEESLRRNVAAARKAQLSRQNKLNSALSASEMNDLGLVAQGVSDLLEAAAKRTALSARGVVRVMRVAATIADLAESKEVLKSHVAEALSFRGLERIYAYAKG